MSLSDFLPGEPIKTLSVRWAGMSFGKFCTVPEFVPYKLNYPGDNCGFDYEMYQGTAPGLEGGHGFINLHYMQGKQGEIDYLYNDSANGMNFMLKTKSPITKEGGGQSVLATPRFNMERKLGGLPFGFLIAGDWDKLDLADLSAGFGGYEYGARTMLPTPVGKLGFQLNGTTGSNKTPTLGAVLDANELMKGLKFGVQAQGNMQKIDDLQFRALMRHSGFTVCTQYTAWGQPKKGKPAPKNTFLTSLRTPSFNIGGVDVVGNAQVKTTPGKLMSETTAAAECDFGSGTTMKLKATNPHTGAPKLGASFIFTGAGGHQICLGTQRDAEGKFQFGFQVWKGYYNFGQW